MSTMAVLVVTHRTQGNRATDFLFADVGELVGITSSRGPDRGRPDRDCGGRRSFTGLESRYCTTTAQVVAQQLTMRQSFPIGTVVERRGDCIRERQP